MRDTIVVSAINFTEGGPLSVLRECLAALAQHFAADYEVVALVHDRTLPGVEGVSYLEFPRSKGSWLLRMYYEYVHFRALSETLRPLVWLSLHDMTPNVVAGCQAVYCHNPAPFFRLSLPAAWADPGFALFNRFYAYLYRINIGRNDVVVVQQEWLRRTFRELFPLRGEVVVAHPESPPCAMDDTADAASDGVCTFFYPAFPRVFKNFEVLCRAAQLLRERTAAPFRVLLTIDGSENRYARGVVRRYRHVEELRFIGLQPRARVGALYRESHCLLFPSKLETWGLPITEYQRFGKPMIVADLPYAKETVGSYHKVQFFPPDDAHTLSVHMEQVMTGRALFDPTPASLPAEPFVTEWRQLFRLLISKAEQKRRGAEP